MVTSTANICLNNCPLVDYLQHVDNGTKTDALINGCAFFFLECTSHTFILITCDECNQLIKCYSKVKHFQSHCSHVVFVVSYRPVFSCFKWYKIAIYLLVWRHKKFMLKMEIDLMEHKKEHECWAERGNLMPFLCVYVMKPRICRYHCTPFNQTYCSTQIKQRGGSFYTFSFFFRLLSLSVCVCVCVSIHSNTFARFIFVHSTLFKITRE